MSRSRVSVIAGAAVLSLVSLGGGIAVGREISSDPEPAAEDTSLKGPRVGDQREEGFVRYVNGADKVSVRGGGSESNCTRDETVEDFTIARYDQDRRVGFIAKNGGSCWFERSYSPFEIEIKGPNPGESGSGRVWLRGPYPYGTEYRMECGSAEFPPNLKCQQLYDNSVKIGRR